MSRSDYEQYHKNGGTYIIPVEIFNELFDELERLSFNYEQALEDLDKKDNIINELENYINEEYIYDELGMKMFDASTLQDKLQELKGSDKE